MDDLVRKYCELVLEQHLVISPKVEVEVEPKPTTVPTPTDSCGLKNT